jgi:hypothetical protein
VKMPNCMMRRLSRFRCVCIDLLGTTYRTA